jgi:quinoprotein glucose dehydrogenase
MYTYRKEGSFYNRVVRMKDAGQRAVFDKVIIDNIPGARLHNGGRIAFGPDGMLYITTGEIFDAKLSQNLKSLAGKILRVTADGATPDDNPCKVCRK